MAAVDNQEVTRIARTYHICHKLSNYCKANVVSTQLSLLSMNLQQSIKTAAVPDEILRIQDNRCTSTPNSSAWCYQILKTKQAYKDICIFFSYTAHIV
jgi:hypothetical protein